jgi:hypothetical protein
MPVGIGTGKIETQLNLAGSMSVQPFKLTDVTKLTELDLRSNYFNLIKVDNDHILKLQ